MIQLKNISIGYDKKHPLKTNLDIEFQGNKIYGLLGQSGKGKTTLLKTIAGLIKPLNGDVLINDKNLKSAKQSDIYMMHQNYTCFDWLTCHDNIAITCEVLHIKLTAEIHDKIDNALKQVGLLEYRDFYPQQLSGGMKQRLALARTMFVNPSVILMDEPLSALDEVTRTNMQKLIVKHHNETNNTIIMITHSKEEAYTMCDDIVHFDNL